MWVDFDQIWADVGVDFRPNFGRAQAEVALGDGPRDLRERAVEALEVDQYGYV